MPGPNSFDYAIVRVVPRVERGEFINVGIILICRAKRYLAARIELDEARLAALFPGLDMAELRQHLEVIPRICAGTPDSGPIGQLSQQEKFHWLVAPRSTVIQVSPPHSGFCFDPNHTLDHLLATLVRLPRPPAG
jgi:hypothetical protein